MPMGWSKKGCRLLTVVVVLLLGGAGVYWFDPWQWWTTPPPEGPFYHWQQAQAALESYDLLLAKKHLEHCLESWPLNGEVHFLLARTGRRAGDFETWRTHLSNAEVLQWSAEDVALERLLFQAQAGDTEAAEQKLLAHPRFRAPGEEELIYEALVKGYLEALRFGDTIRWAGIWAERVPGAWQPYFFRGRAFQLDGKRPPAVADLQRVLQMKPDQADARLELAYVWRLAGQFKEALAEYQTFLRTHPDHPAALVGVAHCQISVGQPEEARANLEKLLDLEPKNPAGLLLLAKLEATADNPDRALSLLRRAEAVAPNEPDVLQDLATTLRRLGRPEEARQYEAKFEKLPERAKLLVDLRTKARQDPRNISLRHRIGALALELGQEEAVFWLNSVLRLDPNHAPTHQALADYYRQQGDLRRAEHHQRRAAEGKTPPPQKSTEPKK